MACANLSAKLMKSVAMGSPRSQTNFGLVVSMSPNIQLIALGMSDSISTSLVVGDNCAISFK
eukprot:630347-Pyramimonas_sp.AAC.1